MPTKRNWGAGYSRRPTSTDRTYIFSVHRPRAVLQMNPRLRRNPAPQFLDRPVGPLRGKRDVFETPMVRIVVANRSPVDPHRRIDRRLDILRTHIARTGPARSAPTVIGHIGSVGQRGTDHLPALHASTRENDRLNDVMIAPQRRRDLRRPSEFADHHD